MNNDDKYNKLVWVIFSMVVIWAMVIGAQFQVIHLKTFDTNKITTLLGSLFAIALFLERCTEVIIAILRNEQAIKLKNALDNCKPNEKQGAEKELNEYRHKTQSISLRISFIVGLVVSTAGIRILEELVDIPKEVVDIALSQKNFFHLVDILITAGVLAGGSDGIHQIMTVYDDNMKYLSKVATNKTEAINSNVSTQNNQASVPSDQTSNTST